MPLVPESNYMYSDRKSMFKQNRSLHAKNLVVTMPLCPLIAVVYRENRGSYMSAPLVADIEDLT